MNALQNGATVIIGRLITALLSLLALRYATTFLAPADYGLLAMLAAIQTFCGLFLINPINQHINRHTHAWWADGTLLPRLASFGLIALLGGLVGAAVGLIAGIGGADAAVALFCAIVAISWNAALIFILNMVGLRGTAALWAAATVVVGLVISVGLVSLWPNASAWLAGQAAGWLLGSVGAYWSLSRRAPSKGKFKPLAVLDRQSLITFCLPLSVSTGMIWLFMNGSRFIIEHYWSLAVLGYVYVGLGLAAQLWGLVETLMIYLLLPNFFRRIGQDEVDGQQPLSDMLNTVGPVYCVIQAAGLFSASALLVAMVDETYHNAIWFLMMGLLLEGARSLANIFCLAVQITRRTLAISTAYAIGAVIVLPTVAGAGWSGVSIERAVSCLAAGGILVLFITAWRMHREVRYKLDWLRWGAAIAYLSIIAAVAFSISARIETLVEALSMIAAAGFVSACVIWLLLWRNPATTGMFSGSLSRI